MGSERVIWERFADAVGIGSKFVLKTIMAMTANMNAAAKEVVDIQNKEWGYAPIIDDILEVIKSQILRMEQAILHWK